MSLIRNVVKAFVKQTPFYYPLRNWLTRQLQKKEIIEWESKGHPVPPPHIVKQRALNEYAVEYNLKILVETGTYYGDMVEAMKKSFSKIYSIEISETLCAEARRRFKRDRHIKIIHGDSGTEIEKLVKELDQPTLFWLDGHYSGGITSKGLKETPIFEEVNAIVNNMKSQYVILIDDARCFGTFPDYPSLELLSNFIKSKDQNANVAVQDDIIRIIPSDISPR